MADLEAGAESEGLEESGKIVLLAQLLPRLRTAGRRVLLLSQSIKMLGILQVILLFFASSGPMDIKGLSTYCGTFRQAFALVRGNICEAS